MSNQKLDLNTLKKLVEYKYDLISALYQYNPEGKYDYTHGVFCPFHNNENTPAAMLYEGKEGQPDSLYCFAEQKKYTVADVVSGLMGYNIYEVGYLLWNDMTEHERQEFLNSIGKVDYSKAFSGPKTNSNNVELNNSKILYKENKISLEQLLGQYLSIK